MKRKISLLFLLPLLFLTACNGSNPSVSDTSSPDTDITESESDTESESESSETESDTDSSESEDNSDSETETDIDTDTDSETEVDTETETETETDTDTDTEIEYTIAWFYNYNNKLLYYDEYVEVGTTPIYLGETPTREKDDEYTYTFKGWDKELEPIYEETEYYATYESEKYFYYISELLMWDETNDQPLYMGLEVNLEDVVINSVYSDNFFSICFGDSYILEGIPTINVFSKENITPTYSYKDIVSIKGVIGEYENRAVILDAEVTWGTSGENYCDDAGCFGRRKLNDREHWETLGRADSGQLYYSEMQLVSLPTIEANKDSSFYVVYPGEDLTISEDNFFLIEIVIPALKENQIQKAIEAFSTFSVGDGINITFQPTYNGDMYGLLCYDILSVKSHLKSYEINNIYQNYEDLHSILEDNYSNNPNCVLDISHNSVYNYTLKTGTEKYQNTYSEFYQVSAYSYNENDVLNHWIDVYSNNENYTYLGLSEGEYWASIVYGSSSDLLISFKPLQGKCVLTYHLRFR